MGSPSAGRRAATRAAVHHLYVDLGCEVTRDSPPVVLVHGVLDSSRSFARLRRLTSEHARVACYDRRGYQRSRAASRRATGIEVHVDDLLDVIEALGSRERAPQVVVLGHSYGGVIALAAAQRRPDVVAAVLAFEPPISWQPPPCGLNVAPEEWTVPYPDEDAERFADRFARTMLGSSRYDRLGADIRAGLVDDAVQASFELTELAVRPAFDPAAIAVPVVVARGELAAPRHVACTDWLARSLPAGRLAVVDGARHGAHISHPRELARLLDELAAVVAGTPR